MAFVADCSDHGEVGNTILLDDEHITLWVDVPHKLVLHRMRRPCFGEVLRNALWKGVEALRSYGCDRWLSDDRASGAVSPEDEQWSRTVWFPAARAAGWKRWALIDPTLVAGRMNMKRFVEAYGSRGIETRVFSDLPSAEAWILRD